MAVTIGQKTKTDTQGVVITIDVVRVIPGGGNGNSPDSIIYKHQTHGSPRQEMSMSETVYNAEGWA